MLAASMQLDWLNETRKLFIRPLIFERVVLDGLQVPPRGQDIIEDKGISWKRKSDGTYLARLTAGRLVVMNRDPMAMTDDERFRLNEKLKKTRKGMSTWKSDRRDLAGTFQFVAR